MAPGVLFLNLDGEPPPRFIDRANFKKIASTIVSSPRLERHDTRLDQPSTSRCT